VAVAATERDGSGEPVDAALAEGGGEGMGVPPPLAVPHSVSLAAADARGDAVALGARERAAVALAVGAAAAEAVAALCGAPHAAAAATHGRPAAHAGRAATRVQAGPSGAAASQAPPGAAADVASVAPPPATDTAAAPPTVSVAKAASAKQAAGEAPWQRSVPATHPRPAPQSVAARGAGGIAGGCAPRATSQLPPHAGAGTMPSDAALPRKNMTPLSVAKARARAHCVAPPSAA